MMKNIHYTSSEKRSVRKLLLSWFADNQRDLPWRDEYEPYQVWISEIMGQQTQMDRVVRYFNRWMELFPDITAVAAAPEQQLLKAWEGLGYYSRVKNIQRTATLLLENHGGQIPADLNQLLALPGIGPYTAAAILSIAFNQPYPVLDANVERVFARLLDLDQPLKQVQVRKKLQAVAADLLPAGKARLFNQALMEFGALACRPKSPGCSYCPLAAHCRALQHGTVDNRPVPLPREKKIEIVMACGIIIHKNKVYIQQRLPDDVWGSLWEFPGGRLKHGETPIQAAGREVFEETEFSVSWLRPLATVAHHYTKYRVTLHGFTCRLQNSGNTPILHAAVQYRWIPLSGLSDFPFPAGHRQLLVHLDSEMRRENSEN
ncbi:MAG: A/G-specific adenine glycosylase [Desulfobulbaceae bacterium]|nr:A/G-specific adenine glycosylase [Desulfobulbaceae bacterium]